MRYRFEVLLCALGMSSVLLTAAPIYAGALWQENGVPACATPRAQEAPFTVEVGAGQSIVVWADVRGYDYDIYAQKLDAQGEPLWTPNGILVCDAIYDQHFPTAVHDSAGGAIIVWQDSRLGDDGMDIYAQRILSDGTAVWPANGKPVCSHEAGLTDPPMAFSHVITPDGSGGAIVAWRDTRSDPINGNTEIYAQKVGVGGEPAWTLNGVKVLGFTTVKWSTRNPVIATDGAGGAVIAWQDGRTSIQTGNDLYIQHVDSGGNPVWQNNGVAVCSETGEQGYPDITSLGGGETAIVWEDKRSGNYDIYVQKFSAAGLPQWGDSGRLICSSANDQRTPRVCGNSFGGILAAWTDKRLSTSSTDIYAQRLDAAGTPVWESQGVPVCTAPGNQTRIRMAPSDSGFVLLTWMDTRNETAFAVYDVYGQMIGPDGSPAWDPAGAPVAALTGSNQRLQQAVTDGEGGLLAVWEDNRNAGDWDVYIQRLIPWVPVSSIAEARSQPLGTLLSMPPRAVTGSFSGFFYVEESNRSAGVKVSDSGTYTPGALVAVVGTLEEAPEPYIRAAAVIAQGTAAVPGALGAAPGRLGSAQVGATKGLTNVGLLVRTWGRVVSLPDIQRPYLIISDGSREVRVYGTTEAAAGDTVVVTGVCSSEFTDTGVEAVVLTRDAADIRRVDL